MAKNGYTMSNRAALEAVTADKTITVLDCGKILTNRGASGAVELLLPTPSSDLEGVNFKMVVHAAQNFKVATGAVDTLVSRNDATADSILSAQIGNEIYVFCDGTSWFAYGATDGGTYTIAT
jgi:hypothetical protein|tara:strand:- start:8977 stop:9342 length:366 start_codon:yes stop_codon:yes gene_type:complete